MTILLLAVVVVVAILVAGFVAWAIGELPLISEPYKRIAQGVLLLAVLVWLIIVVYDVSTGKTPPVPRVFL